MHGYQPKYDEYMNAKIIILTGFLCNALQSSTILITRCSVR